jgi:hypothetical protein
MRRAHVLGIALLPFIFFSTGCDTVIEGEGHLSVRNPEFFSRDLYQGSFLTRVAIQKCDPSDYGSIPEYRARRSGESYDQYERARDSYEQAMAGDRPRVRRLCEGAYETTVQFRSRSMTIYGRAYGVRCQNLGGERVRCVGHDNDSHTEFGPVRYVAVFEGTRLLGFHVWQLASNIELRTASRTTQLIATFGNVGADYVPRR